MSGRLIFRWFEVDDQNLSQNDRCDCCIFENCEISISVLSSVRMWEGCRRGLTFKCQVEGNENDGKPQMCKSFQDRGSIVFVSFCALFTSSTLQHAHSMMFHHTASSERACQTHQKHAIEFGHLDKARASSVQVQTIWSLACFWMHVFLDKQRR